MAYRIKIAFIRLLGYSVIGDNAYPEFLDKNQPIGLDSIKGYLEENCGYPIEVKIIDLHQDDWQGHLREVVIYDKNEGVSLRPTAGFTDVMKNMFDKFEITECDIIGLSAPMSSEKILYLFLKFLMNSPEYRDKVIIVGNLISTFCYDQILEDYPGVFSCVGSGEQCMFFLSSYMLIAKAEMEEDKIKPKIINDFRNDLVAGKAIVPNLFFSHQGVIHKSKESSKKEQEMVFSPSVSTQKEVEGRGGSMRVQSSRGCNFHCGFCVVNKVFGISGRIEFPVEYVLAYIKKVAANSGRDKIRIDFIDDEFLGYPINVKRMTSLFAGIKEIGKYSNKEITFSFATNSNSLKFSDNAQGEKIRDLWFLAKEAGLRKVFLGLESNVPNQLRRYNKYGSPTTNEYAIIFLRDVLGVRIEVAMILVDYEMDEDWRNELLENFHFLYRHGLHIERALLIQVVKPLRFSALFHRYQDKGILLSQTTRYSPIWNVRFLNPEVGRFMGIFEKVSSKKDPLYQLRYRLKQDLLFDLQDGEEKVKKGYKDKLAKLDFLFFRELVGRWKEGGIEEELNIELTKERKKLLLEMKKDIIDGRIVAYAEYYLSLIEAYLNLRGV